MAEKALTQMSRKKRQKSRKPVSINSHTIAARLKIEVMRKMQRKMIDNYMYNFPLKMNSFGYTCAIEGELYWEQMGNDLYLRHKTYMAAQIKKQAFGEIFGRKEAV